MPSVLLSPSPSPVPPASGIYDVTLGGARTIRSIYAYPTLPTVSTTVQANPSNFATLLAANPTNTRFELADGNYPTFRSIPVATQMADLEFVALNPGNVFFTGEFVVANAVRLYFEGLTTNEKVALEGGFGGEPLLTAPVDILFENHHFNRQSGGAEAIVPQGGYQRIMIQNSTIDMGVNQFALIGGNLGDGNVGFISANNYWRWTAGTPSFGSTLLRLMECDQVLFVDDYFQGNRFRMHKNLNQVTVADLIGNWNGVGSGGGFYFITDSIEGDTGVVQNLYIERTAIYDDVSASAGENLWSAMVGPGAQLSPAYANGNRMYFTLETGSDDMDPNNNSSGFAAGEYIDNLRLPYQTPPAKSTQGATGVGRP